MKALFVIGLAILVFLIIAVIYGILQSIFGGGVKVKTPKS